MRDSAKVAAGLYLGPGILSACGNTQEPQDQSLVSSGDAAKPLGVAILGLGGYASGQIAPALQLTKHCKLSGLITGSPEKLPEWQQKYGIADEHCYTYDRLAEIAEDDAIDIVYVITPTSTHREFSIRAALAGKHVWCEKPMAMTAAECKDMIEASKNAGKTLSIGYRMVHEPNTQEFIQLSQARTLGAPTSANSLAGYAGGMPSVDYWRGQREMGGGALYDMGVYNINGLRYATQLRPEKVLKAVQDRPQEVDVTTTFTLQFPGGVIGEGKTSVVEEYNLLRVEFENGWAEMQPMQPYNGVQGSASNGDVFGPPVPNQQSIQMDNDALAILNNTPRLAPGEEGLIDVAIIRAIIESAETGKEVNIDYSAL